LPIGSEWFQQKLLPGWKEVSVPIEEFKTHSLTSVNVPWQEKLKIPGNVTKVTGETFLHTTPARRRESSEDHFAL
jgi:hypothetical protein